MRIRDSGNGCNSPLQLLGHPKVGRPVIADGTNVDLRGKAEIENLGDYVGGLKIEHALRKGGWQHLAQLADIVGGRSVTLLERDQDRTVIDADRRSVGERQVVCPRRQSYIVDDQGTLAFGNDLADLVFDSLENLLGGFNAGSGRSTDMQLDLTAVDQRKEVAAHGYQHGSTEPEDQSARDRDDDAATQQISEERDVAFPHSVKPPVKRRLESPQQALPGGIRSVVTFTFEQQAYGDRRQRARQPIGCEHREYHCEPQWRKQIFRGALEKDDRGEDATDCERRHQCRHRDSGGSVERGFRQRFALLGEQAVRILDRHGRIVDQNSDRERESAERHGVERFAKKEQDDQ